MILQYDISTAILESGWIHGKSMFPGEGVMDYFSSQISSLIAELGRLPGIGNKSAQRLAFHILNMPEDQVVKLSSTILSARKNIRYCKCCCTLTDQEICPICASTKRNHRQIMVVENARDLAAYEKTQKYQGVYHVLHGAISPTLGIGPADIRIRELIERLTRNAAFDDVTAREPTEEHQTAQDAQTTVKEQSGSMVPQDMTATGDSQEEVIIATNSTPEGEATAMYISRLIKPSGIKVSRIASGVPVGGDLEYIDEVTLLRALEGRKEL